MADETTIHPLLRANVVVVNESSRSVQTQVALEIVTESVHGVSPELLVLACAGNTTEETTGALQTEPMPKDLSIARLFCLSVMLILFFRCRICYEFSGQACLIA